MPLILTDYTGILRRLWIPRTLAPTVASPPDPCTKPKITWVVEMIESMMRGEIDSIADPKTAANVYHELDQLLGEVDKLIPVAMAGKGSGKYIDRFEHLEVQLTMLAKEIRKAGSLDEKTRMENTRALFTSAGQWAIHFSVVRMTVTTFLVGLCWGVVSLKWSEPSKPLIWASITVWILSALLLWVFTVFTYEWSQRQSRYLKKIYLDENSKGKNQSCKVYIQCFLGIIALLVLVILEMNFSYIWWLQLVPLAMIPIYLLSAIAVWWFFDGKDAWPVAKNVTLDPALWAYILASVFFAILIQFWQAKLDGDSTTKVVVGTSVYWKTNVHAVEIKNEKFTSLDFTNLSTLFKSEVTDRICASSVTTPTPNSVINLSNAVIKVEHATFNTPEPRTTNIVNKTQKLMNFNVIGINVNRSNNISN